VKLAFFYESGSFIIVFIYTFAIASAAAATTSTNASLLLLQFMLLGIRPVLDFCTNRKFNLVLNHDI
jgi:hypothetical protein